MGEVSLILLWRTPTIPPDAYQRWVHAWKTFAKKASEDVVVAVWSADHLRRAWDAVNSTNGRYVVWARPEFVPHVSMWSELDYLRDQGILVVAQQKYKCAFAPRSDIPVGWTPDGIDSTLVVFQLSGQQTFSLPPSYSLDIWEWLGEEKRATYQVPQRYSGSAWRKVWASRSILGETIYSPFTPTPAGLPFSTQGQREAWEKQLDAWETWLSSTCSA